MKEILRKMESLEHNSDYEEAHGDADDLLVETVVELAKTHSDKIMACKIVAAYGKVGKWYA